MKLALRSVAPGMFAGGAISAVLTMTTDVPLLPTLMWLVFYGLGLLSTMTFAPRSIVLARLGVSAHGRRRVHLFHEPDAAAGD